MQRSGKMVLLPTLPAPAHVLKVKSEGEQRHCGTKRSFTIIMRMATLEELFDKRYFLEAPSCIALIKASAVEVACEPSRQARLRIFSWQHAPISLIYTKA